MATKQNKKFSSHAIISPRITEKGARNQEGGVYVFNVSARANKAEVKKAVEGIYGVTVTGVNMTTIPSKKVSSRKGIPGRTSVTKKAVVSLKKGDVITLS